MPSTSRSVRHPIQLAVILQAEVQQLKQQVADAQQSQDEKLQALKASETGLQEQLAAVTAEADEARERLRSTAQELQVHHSGLMHYSKVMEVAELASSKHQT